jgi:hypothetical protein
MPFRLSRRVLSPRRVAVLSRPYKMVEAAPLGETPRTFNDTRCGSHKPRSEDAHHMIVPFVSATADLDCPRACAVFRLAGVPLEVVVNVTSGSDSSSAGPLRASGGVVPAQAFRHHRRSPCAVRTMGVVIPTVRGRDPELTVLDQHLDQPLSGVGTVVLEEGGVGDG